MGIFNGCVSSLRPMVALLVREQFLAVSFPQLLRKFLTDCTYSTYFNTPAYGGSQTPCTCEKHLAKNSLLPFRQAQDRQDYKGRYRKVSAFSFGPILHGENRELKNQEKYLFRECC